MQIRFTINYKTNYGENLKILGNIPQLGKNKVENAAVMFPVDGEAGVWDCFIDIPDEKAKKISYKYFIQYPDGNTNFEWGEERKIEFEKINSKNIQINDNWRDSKNPLNAFHTSAFSEIIFKRPKKRKKPLKTISEEKKNVIFKLENFRVEKNHSIAITGDCTELGKWDKKKIVLLDENNFPEWSKIISFKKSTKSILYKYCIVDTKTKKVITEEYQDRYLEFSKDFNTIVQDDVDFKYPVGNWKGIGVAIPVFSLRTKNGHGVGEFLDIKLLVDWAKKTGLKLVQILPINDTVATHTWVDSYPYAAISVFALHPIYLNLKAIGNLSTKITQEIVEEQKKLLNERDKVDYEAVMKIKSRFYKLIYDEQKDDFQQNEDFKKFFKENKYWLEPYAVFSYLRDLFGTPDFSKWGRFGDSSKELLDELADPKASHYDDIAIHYFIQYHLHIQLVEAAEYARKQGVILKGDIPIGIYRNSVDAWMETHLFNMDAQAGAPPDDFSDEGQNWRFPTYNWDEMQKDNFKWWQNRLKKLSCYFDSFRIDHILGFFRIWEIPQEHVQGIMGYFNPSIPIYPQEFNEKGLNFDFYRYCTPYIREHMLHPIFGDMTQYVKDNFLVEYELGKFYLKEEFNTQKKVEDFVGVADTDTPFDRGTKEYLCFGLYKLIAEVIFVPYPHAGQETFVPRHSVYKTNSFKELGQYEQQKVMELYNDYYFRRNEDFWKHQAYMKLPPIKNATEMMICGEDLGMIPACVPEVMSDLGILSLEVQRMPKNEDIEFAHPNDYPYLSVATPSSHDTSTIRGWWEEDSARSQRFYNQILGKWGNSPFYCEPWLVKEIIIQHIYSPSMWVVFPIQDLFGMDEKLRYHNASEERINVPSNPRHYWRYRMHINLEDLLTKEGFNEMLKNMFTESGRLKNY